MPYNLRVRKVVEPRESQEVPESKPKTAARKRNVTATTAPAKKARKTTKSEPAENGVEEHEEPKETKEPKALKEPKEVKEPKEIKAPRAPKSKALKELKELKEPEEELEEPKETKQAKEPKQLKESKQPKDVRETKKAKKSKELKESKVPDSTTPNSEPVAEEEPEPMGEADDVKQEPEIKKTEKRQREPDTVQELKKTKVESNQLVFGADTCGELGFKKIGCTRKNPTPVPLGVAVKQVACGPMHTLSLTESGQIYSYGCNDEGALGRVTDGDETLEATPTVIEMNDVVTKISTGDSHGAALTEKNGVFIWGNFRDEHGSVGLLPDCDGQATYKPIQVLPDKEFKDIASGSNHMLLLDVDGVVYSFGVGAQGQLGRLSNEQVGSTEKSVSINTENRSLFLTPMPVSMKNVDPAREFICDAIYAGNFSSFATNTDKKKNRLAAWGLNNYYQLGYKGQQKGQLIQYYPRRSTFTCSTSMISVACGQHHTIFLTKNGRVYAAGRNEYGMLGVKAADKSEVCPAKQVEKFDGPITTICAGINTSFAVSGDGKLYSWGMNGMNLGIESGDDDLMEPTEMKSLAAYKVISVSSGSSFTAVIVEN